MQKIHLLKSKTEPPAFAGTLLQRSHLEALLNKSTSAAQLTLVIAPAGFGKTAMLAQWVMRQRRLSTTRQVSWLTLDDADIDIGRFCSYLSQTLFDEQLPDIDAILFALESQTVAKLLVIDNAHIISEGSDACQFLRYFIAHAPRSLHLILASRLPLHLGLTQMLMEDRISLITDQDLSFTAQEAQALFALNHHKLSLAKAQKICDVTHGWPAAIRLFDAFDGNGTVAATRLSSVIAPPSRQDRITSAPLPDSGSLSASQISTDIELPPELLILVSTYLLEEVFQQMPPDEQRVVFTTALLDIFCTELAEDITGLDRATVTQAFDRLLTSKVFLEEVPRSHGVIWYRYQPFFLAVLRQGAQRSRGLNIDEVLKRATLWYERKGNNNQAAQCARRINDYERIINLMLTHWRSMFMDDRIFMFYSWGRMLPDELLLANPKICSLLSVAAVLSEDAALSSLCAEVAHAHFVNPSQDFYAESFALKAQFEMLKGNYSQGRLDAQSALELLPPEDYFLRISAIQAIHVGAYILDFLSYRDALIKHLPQVLAHGRQGYIANYNAFLAAAEGQLGNFRSAAAYAEKALQTGHIINPMRPTSMNLYLARTNAAYYHGALGEAELHRKMYQDVSKEGFASRDLSAAYAFGALFCFSRGRTTEALDRLQLSARTSSYGLLMMTLPLSMILEIDKGGDFDFAVFIAQTHEIYGGTLFWRRLDLAHALAHGQLERLNEMRELAASVVRDDCLNWVYAYLLLSIYEERAGNTQEAETALSIALQQAEHEQILQMFVNEYRDLLPIMSRLINTTQASDFTQAVFSQLSLMADGGSSSAHTVEHIALTARENDVVYLLISGYRPVDIAERLIISKETVRRHIANIYAKFGVHSRSQLTQYFS
ncbi:MAG: LuxR C-terminal-related transcriptional regulator [Coriobacteriales bacterium]|nr:LuxR C-terminal-related transcriptional regulator [Coriobacteriales bacterium]